MRIDVALVDTVPLGVDTPADLARARALAAPSADAMTEANDPPALIAFQGEPGAYSDLACREVFPRADDAAVRRRSRTRSPRCASGRAALAMLPIENSVAGRVADIHHLLPDSGLHIIGEHFQRVNHHLLALPGATLADLKTVRSHVHALSQCRDLIRALGLQAGGRGRHRRRGRRGRASAATRSVAAIASALAGKIYGLVSLAEHRGRGAQHHALPRHGARRREPLPADGGLAVTTFVFRVRNVPAALYKAMGGFATNGVNMTKLESYMVGGRFTATQFYADVEGHPDDRPLKLALEELRFFSEEVKILGVYPGHPFRRRAMQDAGD